MNNYKSFQIIFEETDGKMYSATFDLAIPLTCRGKFVDIEGKIHNLGKYYRTIHPDSTTSDVIHSARVGDQSICDFYMCNDDPPCSGVTNCVCNTGNGSCSYKP